MEYNLLKIIALSVWWGAFTFYAGIVVPQGMAVLGTHTLMGLITEKVSIYLNGFSLGVFFFYAFLLSKESVNSNRLIEQITIVTLVGFQFLLVLVHTYLSDLIDFEEKKVLDYDLFYLLHRIYLIIETIIWLIVSVLIIKAFKKLKVLQ